MGGSTWLPFAGYIAEHVGKGRENNDETDFVGRMMSHLRHFVTQPCELKRVLKTPVFLGYGVDDETIGVKLGRQARMVLEQLGIEVEWKEYEGAELNWHWVKVPEEMDDIARFLRAVESKNISI